MVTLHQRIALSCPWWSWDSKLIRKALWASVLTRLRRLGNERLKANDASGRFPTAWRDLEFLRKEARTQRRVFDGDTNLCPELLLGYASLLGINAAECFPDTHTWIAEAAVYLSLYAEESLQPVSIDHARIFVQHVLPIVASRPKTSACVQAHIEQVSACARPIVLSVGQALGPLLAAHDPDARELLEQAGAKR